MEQCEGGYGEVTLDVTTMGGLPVTPRLPTTSFRISKPLLDAVKAKAEELGTTPTDVFQRLVGGWVAGVIPLPSRTVLEFFTVESEKEEQEEGPP